MTRPTARRMRSLRPRNALEHKQDVVLVLAMGHGAMDIPARLSPIGTYFLSGGDGDLEWRSVSRTSPDRTRDALENPRVRPQRLRAPQRPL